MPEFIHTPSQTIQTPETFFDTTTGITYTVWPDDAASDPRGFYDDTRELTSPQVFIYNSAPHTVDDLDHLNNFNELTRDFVADWQHHGDDPQNTLDRVIANANLPESSTATGFVKTIHIDQSSWVDIVALSTIDAASQHTNQASVIGILDGLVDELINYLYGNVWCVSCDLPNSGAMGNIIAESSEGAIAHYRDSEVNWVLNDSKFTGLRIDADSIRSKINCSDVLQGNAPVPELPYMSPAHAKIITDMSDLRINRIINEYQSSNAWVTVLDTIYTDVINDLCEQIDEHDEIYTFKKGNNDHKS